ncbi:hypothetical protein HRR82_004246 [Exophiala dermatitidis]|nr:hypothetical protein HRR82_004246 [Exophiala dermatitidis]
MFSPLDTAARMDGLQVAQPPRGKAFVPPEHDKFGANATPGAVDPGYATEYTSQVGQHSPPKLSYRFPWGLSLFTYTLLIVGITFVICGAGFGGAIGAVAANNKHSEPNTETVFQTTTVTATATASVPTAAVPTASATASAGLVNDYVVLPPDQVNTTTLTCADESTMTTKSGARYQLHCNVDFGNNDILWFISYSLEICLEACSNLNTRTGNATCNGVIYNANVGHFPAGNCWLKSAMLNPSIEDIPPSVGATLLT